MKAEIKRAWLEALRSGKYLQARGYLHLIEPKQEVDIDGVRVTHLPGFCCLGVLCEITGLRKDRTVSSFETYRDKQGGYMSTVLTAEMLREHKLHGIVGTLMSKNDNGESFAEIADFIELAVPAEETAS